MLSFLCQQMVDRLTIYQSFNLTIYSVNGVPACANKKLLTDILRTKWKFKGVEYKT
jgi:beta-glucosidase-like glycosyl hydrolase